MTGKITSIVIAVSLFLIATFSLSAQINTPRGSQKGEVSQTIGTSTISIEYSRPKVNGREIYGTPLVHYGFQDLGFGTSKSAPWRAGANENTTISFSHDMKVEGQAIKAGTYGLHIDVHEDNSATYILSNNSTSWGSYFYDEAEDALRAPVTTMDVPHTEVLTFDFEEVTANTARVILKWEKRAFPLNIEVPVTDIVLGEIRNSMRDQPGFNRQTWEQAAGYALNNDGDLNEALAWIDKAIAGQFFSQKTFTNVQLKSAILNKMGRQSEALKLMDEAKEIGTILEVHQLGRQLITMGMKDKALEVFQYNATKNANVWPVNYGLARGYSANGNYKTALAHLKKALVNAPNDASKGRVAANIEKLEKSEDIN